MEVHGNEGISKTKVILNDLEKNKISTENIIQDGNQQTGVAGILVDQNTGKNAINVIVGAPSSLKISEIEKQIHQFFSYCPFSTYFLARIRPTR